MKLFLTTILLFVVASGFAQDQTVYFLKNDGRYVKDRDSADYMRVVTPPDSGSNLYTVLELYPSGLNKFIGKSSVIDPPKLEGTGTTYYKDGNRKAEANYKAGAIVGEEIEYYPNGRLYIQRKYPDSVNIYSDFTNDYLITAEYDSLGTAMVTNGNGYYKEYDEDFKTIIEEGNLKNGLRDGLWKGLQSGLKISYTETYANGKLISGISVGEKGDTVKYSGSRGVEPAYSGGLQAFYTYVGKNIVYPDYERAHNIQGKVIVKFIVEKDGSISHITILKSVSANIDKEALRVISSSPAWIPGTQFGRKVSVYYDIPLNFTLKN